MVSVRIGTHGTTGRPRPGRGWLGATSRALIAAMVAFVALPLFAGPASAAPAQDATINEIVADPSAYYGKTVTISGEVDESLGPRAFQVEDSDLLFNEQMLVVSARPIQGRAAQVLRHDTLVDRSVRVTGTVHM